MSKLDRLEKEWLINTLKNNFEGQYYCEAQIQFELAWLIKEQFDADVKLEFFSMIEKEHNPDKSKRDYTDILVQDGDECVAIELKYKTTKDKTCTNEEDNYTNQGATDLGRFDYLWDINRLELLVYGNGKYSSENDMRKEANKYRKKIEGLKEREFVSKLQNNKIRGYAIVITNEKNYWLYTKDKNKDKKEPFGKGNGKLVYKDRDNVQYADFCIGQEDKTHKNTKLNWTPDSSNGKYKNAVRKTFRGRPLMFLGEYEMKWEDFNVSGFKFCICEVKTTVKEK